MRIRTTVKNALLALAIASPAIATGSGFTNMYLLGDSLSDQGNLFYATEYLTGLGIPANDHYWEGRFADGEIWAGVLADRLDITLEPSLFRDHTFDFNCVVDGSNCGTNFAYGGARTDYHRVEDDATKPVPVSFLGQGGLLPEEAFPWTLSAQREAFASRGTTDPDALYVVLSGANDLSDLISMVALCNSGIPGSAVFCFERGDPEVTIPVVLSGINNAIATFVAAGARDILVPNMPNLGVVPSITMFGQGFMDLATGLSEQYNLRLEEMLAQWEGQVNIIRFDTFSLLTKVVMDPDKFDFSNATEPCYEGFVVPNPAAQECDEPDTHVFWDVEHPTAAFNAFLAEEVLKAIALDILDDLIMQVIDANVPPGIERKLVAYLDDASALLTDDEPGNDELAVDVVEDFKEYLDRRKAKHVNRGKGRQISQDTADVLIDRAVKLESVLRAI